MQDFVTTFGKLVNIPTALSQALIISVVYETAQGRLLIRLSSPVMVDESTLAAFEQELASTAAMPKGLRRVEIDMAYTNSGIEAFWPNLLYRLERKSPFISSSLSAAAVSFDNTAVNIKSPAADMLKKMAAESVIMQIAQAALSLSPRISIAQAEAIVKPKEAAPTIQRRVAAKSSAPAHASHAAIQSIKAPARPLSDRFFADEDVVVSGKVFRVESRVIKSKYKSKGQSKLFMFDITDDVGSMTVKFFVNEDKLKLYAPLLKKGAYIKASGKVEEDSYSSELVIMAKKVAPHKGDKASIRMDNADEKRVELHLHSNMSQMDGIVSIKSYVERAAAWGHEAIAVTDHGVVQAFPELMAAAAKAGVKPIYGLEAYVVDDLSVNIATRPKNTPIDHTTVLFDLETTGFNREHCTIIEIGAVKLVNGEVVDRFNMLIDPKQTLPKKIVEITNITDEMLAGQPLLSEALPKFIDFIGDAILVAHNAEFDMGFLEYHGKIHGFDVTNPYLCTLQLARALYPRLGRHNLAAISRHLGITLENHHRACDDAEALSGIYLKFIETLKTSKIQSLNDINNKFASEIDVKRLKSRHCTILVQNQAGMRNLYELVSIAHLEFFYRYPLIPKSRLIAFREGLLLGSACENGELFSAVKEDRPVEQLEELAQFYDYFEIMPVANNAFLIERGEVSDEDSIRDINKKIVEYGKLYGKPVCATGNAHYLDPPDAIFKKIIMAGNGFKNAAAQPPLHFKTTDEMLDEFSYLDDPHEVVIHNPKLVVSMIENPMPIPKGTFPPVIEGAEEELIDLVSTRAKARYGDPLPSIVAARIERELDSIVKNGFATLYIAAYRLIKNSMDNGYLVGSRGSIGSSLVATMADVTEVNPLPPHYYCAACQFTDFDSDIVRSFSGGSGCDMPDRLCPNCQGALNKDGHHIPFETFLGFDGDKEPDIDLNFSGEYQAQAHAYATELFGEGQVFKAGTIATVAEKTAYGYTMKYLEEQGRVERNAEVNRLSGGVTGIKRTTGQHPGGLMIVPRDKSIYDFCPVQRPANDQKKKDVITTHFDYPSLSGRLLKLDILGHDVPTIIKNLQDMTGVDPLAIDIGDKDIVSLFTSPKRLGVTPEEIASKTGTLGLPEFGTGFVRQMLTETQPQSFAELVRISGLSHGTNVWLNNGQELIRSKTASLKEIIPTRDDIMVYLIGKGVEPLSAFKIMENVRKGKGLTDDEEATLVAANVPKWYIESCKKIEYMFPKGHAVAYTLMTMRIGYFKIHHPEAFYAASFSAKSIEFDYDLMCRGRTKVQNELRRLDALGNQASQKEQKSYSLLELVNEMYARGLSFAPLDLYLADSSNFILTADKGIMPPLCTIQGLGTSVADLIVSSRVQGEFYSIEDFKNRTHANKNVIQLLKNNDILKDMPETDQLVLEF